MKMIESMPIVDWLMMTMQRQRQRRRRTCSLKINKVQRIFRKHFDSIEFCLLKNERSSALPCINRACQIEEAIVARNDVARHDSTVGVAAMSPRIDDDIDAIRPTELEHAAATAHRAPLVPRERALCQTSLAATLALVAVVGADAVAVSRSVLTSIDHSTYGAVRELAPRLVRVGQRELHEPRRAVLPQSSRRRAMPEFCRERRHERVGVGTFASLLNERTQQALIDRDLDYIRSGLRLSTITQNLTL